MPAGAPLRIAHGFGNSRESVCLALESRVDVLEADVRLRRDRLWLGHECRLPLLPVLVGRRPLHPTLRRHRALPLGPWQARLDTEPLPLEELLAIVAGRRRLLLDLKSRRQSDVHPFVAALARLLRRSGQVDSTRLCGDWPLLDEARSITPQCKAYYSVADRRQWRALVDRLEKGDVRGVSLHAGLFDASTAGFLRERGLEVFCWAVDDSAEAARVTELGVDGVISSDLTVLDVLGRCWG